MEHELTVHARGILVREREITHRRLNDVTALIDELSVVLDRLQAERQQLARRLHQVDDGLELSPQLPLDALDADLRGRRLREVAVEVLRQRRPLGEAIHYKDWLRLLEECGVQVGGKDPGATLLTQISRCEEVASVRPRSGLYRLRS